MRKSSPTLATVALAFVMACGAASATTIDAFIDIIPGFTPTSGPLGTTFTFTGVVSVDTAQVGSTSLTITDRCLFPGACVNISAWEMRLTASTPGFFNGLELGFNSFTGLTDSVLGDTLTVDWAGGDLVGGRDSAVFTYDGGVSASPTPLPAALPLFATGLGALGLLGWRRKQKLVASSIWYVAGKPSGVGSSVFADAARPPGISPRRRRMP